MKVNSRRINFPKAGRAVPSAPRRRRQEASVLVLTIIFCALVGIVLVAYLSMLKSQHVFTHRSQVWNTCIPLCEAGIEEAMAHLNHSGTIGNNFAINGWVLDAGTYRKQRHMNGGIMRMAISTDDPPVITVNGLLRAPLQTNYITRTVRVRTEVNEQFPYSMLSPGKINLSGQKTVVDSFHSGDPLFSTLGMYDPLKRKDDATVVTTSQKKGDMDIGDASIFGHIGTGGGEVAISGGSAGSTLWNLNPLNNGRIQPGWFSDDVNVSIPEAALPPSFSPVMPGGGTINGTNYAYVLNSGDYILNGINLSDKGIIITGKARLHVNGATSLSGSAFILLDEDASVEFYASGDINVSGQGIINSPGLARNFAVTGLEKCDSINYSGEAKFIGTIFAPDSEIKMSGQTEAIGALVGRSITLSGDMSFHYDEALRANPGEGRFIAASWLEL